MEGVERAVAHMYVEREIERDEEREKNKLLVNGRRRDDECKFEGHELY